MSKQLVARALAELSDSRVLIRSKIIDEPIATLIRAVDEQYPEGYDEQEGLDYRFMLDGSTRCPECYANPFLRKHNPDCHRWNARVALLALCRDITGEKG